MTLRAYMRVLGAEERPLELVPMDVGDDVACVNVPGFGHLIVITDPEHEGFADTALLTRGPGTETRRDVKVVDGRIECELLHKGDRLCVVVERTP